MKVVYEEDIYESEFALISKFNWKDETTRAATQTPQLPSEVLGD
ncbi:19860_t:CDS:2 [Gigaspora margarita]|uniref:19860_t:CDS:1 n=1 Tax=Gigaspora margarita TaxID=4874 RepID=A0ABN7UEX9_GIGMA|nr:19860_t:CDS:2 [Gigaspora margarita]